MNEICMAYVCVVYYYGYIVFRVTDLLRFFLQSFSHGKGLSLLVFQHGREISGALSLFHELLEDPCPLREEQQHDVFMPILLILLGIMSVFQFFFQSCSKLLLDIELFLELRTIWKKKRDEVKILMINL